MKDSGNVIIVAGVAGAGKSTIGPLLAERLGFIFHDGNERHPPENVKKMANGIPLNDNDRIPWLLSIKELVTHYLSSRQCAVIECSALKEQYRNCLFVDNVNVLLAFLHLPQHISYARVRQRKGHFFRENLVDTQYSILELPDSASIFDATQAPSMIVQEIIQRYKL